MHLLIPVLENVTFPGKKDSAHVIQLKIWIELSRLPRAIPVDIMYHSVILARGTQAEAETAKR